MHLIIGMHQITKTTKTQWVWKYFISFVSTFLKDTWPPNLTFDASFELWTANGD